MNEAEGICDRENKVIIFKKDLSEFGSVLDTLPVLGLITVDRRKDRRHPPFDHDQDYLLITRSEHNRVKGVTTLSL